MPFLVLPSAFAEKMLVSFFLNCLAALVLLSLISCGLRRPHTPRDKRILQIFELGGLDVPGVG